MAEARSRPYPSEKHAAWRAAAARKRAPRRDRYEDAPRSSTLCPRSPHARRRAARPRRARRARGCASGSRTLEHGELTLVDGARRADLRQRTARAARCRHGARSRSALLRRDRVRRLGRRGRSLHAGLLERRRSRRRSRASCCRTAMCSTAWRPGSARLTAPLRKALHAARAQHARAAAAATSPRTTTSATTSSRCSSTRR